MSVTLAPPMFLHFDNPNNSGSPAAGFKLFTYQAGTTSKQATWTDATQGTQNANPIVLDANGNASVWGDPTLTYKFVLANPNDSDPPTSPLKTTDAIQFPLGSGSGAALPNFPQTTQEQAASVTPGNTFYWAQPIADVRRYGWSAGQTPIQNASSLNQAITALNVISGVQGGTIMLPPGAFALAPGLVTVPQNVIIRGAGKRATYITATASGSSSLFLLGGSSATATYGAGLSDFSVQWTGTTGNVITVQGCVGAELARLYLEGETISSGRLTSGVIFDACNATSGGFFNKADSVECNHFHAGFTIGTTGSVSSTQQILINCNATGDVATDSSSVGLFFNSSSGQGTIVSGCDFEDCQYGVDIGGSVTGSGVGPIAFYGLRGESNTTADVIIRNLVNPCTFVGCQFGSTTPVVNNAGAGFQKHRFYGCFPTTAAAGTGDTLYLATANSQAVGDIPLQTIGFPSQTANLFQCLNNTNTPLFQVGPSGGIGLYGVSPPGAQSTGWGSPVGAAVINNYNITDAGGANSNTNKALAEVIVILKNIGLVAA